MLTVVGYDDNKSYDVNGNGIIEDCEKVLLKQQIHGEQVLFQVGLAQIPVIFG